MEAAEEGVAVVVEARRAAEAAALEVVEAEQAALTAAGEAHTEARTVEHFQLHTARPKTGRAFFVSEIFARSLLCETTSPHNS